MRHHSNCNFISTIIILLNIVVPFYLYADFTKKVQFSGPTSDTDCLSWADCNGDSFLDMFVGNTYLRMSYLYINNQDGTFSEYPLFGGNDESAAAWADFDNDGDQDLAIGRWGAGLQSYIYINNGQGSFIKQIPFGKDDTIHSLAWGDCDNDGDLDLAVVNTYKPAYICINNGDGSLTEKFIDNEICHGTTAAFGDYDCDGDLDLAVARAGQRSNFLYINNGDGTFVRELQFGEDWTLTIAWGDYDNDGDLDIAIGNGDFNGLPGAQSYLYVNEGNGKFHQEIQFGYDLTATLAWGDYDNDGDLDLCKGTVTSIPPFYVDNYLYINNGDGSFTKTKEFGIEETISMAWGDYDNDGDIDLACGNTSQTGMSGDNYLYINNENDNDFLSVLLVGHYYDKKYGYSNRDGIGAKIYIYESDRLGESNHLLGFREIEANGGCSGQDSIEAEFGIPNHTEVDLLIIWPGSNGSHIEEYWKGVSKGQFLTLHEGTGTTYLNSDTKTISAVSGGKVIYSIDAWPRNANRDYLLLGGISGTLPGIPFHGGKATLPLNWDIFTDIVLLFFNSRIFSDFMGTLDSKGQAQAILNAPPVPGFIGITMYYAYVLNKPFDFASNAVAIEITP